MTNDINWTNTRVKLSDLKPWVRNPRQITEKQGQRLLESWEKFGQPQVVVIGPDNEVYDGHQRLDVLLATYGPGYEVDARMSSRPLTEKEREEFVITIHTGATGSWDWDALSGWDTDDLLDWGFDQSALMGLNNDAANLRELLFSEDEIDVDEEWSGMPEFDQADMTSFSKVIVHFPTREDMLAFSQLVHKHVNEKTKFIWYPEKPAEEVGQAPDRVCTDAE